MQRWMRCPVSHSGAVNLYHCHLRLNHPACLHSQELFLYQNAFILKGWQQSVYHCIYGRHIERTEWAIKQKTTQRRKIQLVCVCAGEIYSHFGRRVSEAHCQLHLVFVSPEYQTLLTLTNVSAVYQDNSPSRRTTLENKLRTWNVHFPTEDILGV